MKSLKLLVFMLIALMANSIVYAQVIISRSDLIQPNNIIHQLIMNNTSSKLINVALTLNLGKINNNKCEISKSEFEGTYTIQGRTKGQMVIDGDALARLGLDYSCMDIAIKTDIQVFHDLSKLYSNGMTYTASSPAYVEINL